MERLIYIENCMICGISINNGVKNELTIASKYSGKPIYQFIEEFTNTDFSEEIINEAGVCERCLDKFNEYDQFSTFAKQIQQEIITLFEETISEGTELKPETIENDSIVFDAIEEDDTVQLKYIELDILENTKLPKEFQSPEDGHKIVKSKSVKSEGDESLIVIQLDNNAKLYQCEICQRTFKEKSKLKSHRQIHTTERNIVCPVCKKTFKTQACLRSHRRVHNPTTIECDYCGKTYTQKPELIKHINFVHFNRRDYHCDLCNASFGCKGHLKSHYLTHQQFKGVSCEVCGYSFHTKAKLQRHMKSHSGVRDYECGICQKRFLYSYNVSAHIRHVHWKEKRKIDESSRTCSFCGKKFQKIWKLREHLQEEHQFIETEIIDESDAFDDTNPVELEEFEES